MEPLTEACLNQHSLDFADDYHIIRYLDNRLPEHNISAVDVVGQAARVVFAVRLLLFARCALGTRQVRRRVCICARACVRVCECV